MYSFNGDYKRSPIQSLGGRSVETDRQTLIKNAQVERKRREEIRKKEISSLKIQSYFRQAKLKSSSSKIASSLSLLIILEVTISDRT